MRSSVLPDPAGDWTRNDCRTSSASARWAISRASNASASVIVYSQRVQPCSFDPAQRLQAAGTTWRAVVARRHGGDAFAQLDGKIGNLLLPAMRHAFPSVGLAQGGDVHQVRPQLRVRGQADRRDFADLE